LVRNTVATLCLVPVSCYTSDMWLVFNWLVGCKQSSVLFQCDTNLVKKL